MKSNEYVFVVSDGNSIKEITMKASNRTLAMDMFSKKYFNKKTHTWPFRIYRIFVNEIDKGKFVLFEHIQDKADKIYKATDSSKAFSMISNLNLPVEIKNKLIEYIAKGVIGSHYSITPNYDLYCVKHYKEIL